MIRHLPGSRKWTPPWTGKKQSGSDFKPDGTIHAPMGKPTGRYSKGSRTANRVPFPLAAGFQNGGRYGMHKRTGAWIRITPAIRAAMEAEAAMKARRIEIESRTKADAGADAGAETEGAA